VKRDARGPDCLDEDTGAALVGGWIEAAERPAIEHHIDRCISCQMFVAALANMTSGASSERVPTDRTLQAGDRLGPYTIVDTVGRGATSVVYEAHDPKLERSVALKLLDGSEDREDERNARLLDEARAMAKLRHANVLAVFDAGVIDDTVFIAMELVRGQTLRHWLDKHTRSMTEIIRAFIAAGRGLAAAHAAGLVHRDFKPDNVLVDGDGHVLVTDFGLSRSTATAASSDGVDADLRVTRTGGVVGTPAYMAPEQVDGVGDPSSDQFSFCVALYEALAGTRPFAGDDLASLLANVRAGHVRGRLSPRWLDRAVRRGLATDPAQRFPSMAALLATLERGIRPRRWLVPAAIAGLAAATTGVLIERAIRPAHQAACADAHAGLDGVWDAQKRQQLRAAFAATGTPYALDTARTIERHLDEYAEKWALMRADVCTAAGEGRWTSELGAMSDACFTERLTALGAVVDVLAHVDAKAAARASTALSSLPDLETCRRPAQLGAWKRESADPLLGVERTALGRALADIDALLDTGQFERAAAALPSLVSTAHMLGMGRAEAMADVLDCKLEQRVHHAERAEAACHRAAQLASSIGQPDLAARAWVGVMQVVSNDFGRYDEADRWAEYARAALAQTSGAPLIEGTLELALGTTTMQRGRLDEARAHDLKGLAIFEQVYGKDSLRVADVLSNLGIVEDLANNRDQALAYYGHSLSIRTAELGDRHPDVAASLGNIAIIEINTAKYDDARAHLSRALAITEAALPGNVQIGLILANRGYLELHVGDYGAAASDIERSLAILTAAQGDKQPRLAIGLLNLASVRIQLGQAEQALQLSQRAYAIARAVLDEHHETVLKAHIGIGEALIELGRPREALLQLRPVFEEVVRQKLDATFVQCLIGRAEARLGMRTQAEADLTAALARVGDAPDDWKLVADLHFELAKLRWTKDHTGARWLATRAHDEAGRAPDGANTTRAIEHWLSEHAG
jgi:tetratricopeptide (TPR) repeat protein